MMIGGIMKTKNDAFDLKIIKYLLFFKNYY